MTRRSTVAVVVVASVLGVLALTAAVVLFVLDPLDAARRAAMDASPAATTELTDARRRLVLGVPLLVIVLLVTALATRWRERAAPRTAGRLDPLTGAATRPELHERLSHALAASERTGRRVAILFLDLDDFKRLNDEHGHAVGDDVLTIIAERLRSDARRTDLVVRWGGDEFVILLDHLTEAAGAATVAEKFLAEVSQPIVIHDLYVSTTASAGIAVAPDATRDPDELIRLADTAMYAAKTAGGDAYRFCTPQLRSHAQARSETLRELQQAIDEGRLELQYQPQLAADSGRVVAAEALVRWPRRGGEEPMRAADFIALTRTSSLAEALGTWVVERAVAQLAAWDAAGAPGLRVAVNCGQRHLARGTILEDIADSCGRHGISPARLELEVQEDTLRDGGERIESALRRLQALGVRVVLDGFGLGMTSVRRLGELPIDALKLHAELTTHLLSQGEAMVAGVIGLAAEFDLEVIVQHVEDREQLERALELGCHRVQGHLVGRPVPGDAIPGTVTRHPA